jgi:hypothetical protein
MFGYGDMDDVMVIVGNTCSNSTESCYPYNKHTYTHGVALFLYGMFHIIIVVIMLNMVIATMSNTLNQTQVRVLTHFLMIYLATK